MESGSKVVPMQFVRRYKLTEHVCPVCVKTFQGPKLRVYCSQECVRKAAWERHGAEWNENRKEKRLKVKLRDDHGHNQSGGTE
jgi:hypothetical protein